MQWKKIILAVFVLVLGAGAAFFVYQSEPKLNKNFESAYSFFKKFPFRLGLDLSGGSHLVYQADVSAVSDGEVSESMEALRDVIERRENLFGVSEPVVQVQSSSFVRGGDEKLIVDLPGVTDVEKATTMIGQTPLLQFKIQTPEGASQEVQVDENGQAFLDLSSQFIDTNLTGRYLKKAVLEFNPNTREPVVGLQFDETGAELFAQITKDNVGKMVAIYLDGAPIFGFLLVAFFLIFWYRLPGLVAVFSLLVFISIMLSLFKLIPITLTAAGIAGFIISIGIAVDANVLIFERIKEELRSGLGITDAVSLGFSRAWLSIRDSNFSSLITALILFWFGTSLIKGFALTLGMGVLVSMFSAIVATRIFLRAIGFVGKGKVARFLFNSGISK